MHTIETKDLTKVFSSNIAVNHLSFKISEGSVTALLGPNGAGKTTTMRLLTGFLKPTAGDIFYNNISLKENSNEIKKKLGYLPELAPLYYDMNIFEYLDFMGQIREIPKNQIRKHIEEMIERCQLETHIKSPIHSLSKGFKQRVALAGTLIHRPDFIILDEPTSGLDPNQITQVRKLIQSLGQKKTLILSTHILQEVEEICEHVIIINKGKLVANSSVKDLHRGNQIQIVTKENKDSFSSFIDSEKLVLSESIPVAENFYQYSIDLQQKKPEDIFEKLKKTSFSIREFKITQKSMEHIFEEVTK